jgi:hypothetical protein
MSRLYTAEPRMQIEATLDRSGLLCRFHFRLMSYHVVAFTMAQVRQGALEFQRQLSAALPNVTELKVYSVSPFDLDERRRTKDRFGGDIVYFFNDVARQESRRLGLDLQFLAEIPNEELPRRRTVVVGTPESKIRV